MPQWVWASWHAEQTRDPDNPFERPKPWFFYLSTLARDAEIAKSYGVYPWQYYADTTARQRLLLRYLALVHAKREEMLHDYHNRHREG